MRKEKNGIPQFSNETQEAEYFDKHSPLDVEGEPKLENIIVHGTKNRPITIRLDSGTRAKLNILAAKQGLGPSTFARRILISVIENDYTSTNTLSLDELKSIMDKCLPQSIKDRAENLTKSATLGGNPEKPGFLLLDQSNLEEWAEFGLDAISILLSIYGIKIITPEHTKYEEVKTLVRSGI